MNKRLLFILFFFLLVIIYLNRSYARIYDTIGGKNLKPPTDKRVFVLENNNINNPAIKYIALGDSFSDGVGVQNFQETFPYLFAEKLKQNYSEVTFINLSQPGATTLDVIKNQLPQVLSQKPDYITLLIGVNDIHHLTPREDFQKNYSEIIDQLSQKTKAKIIVLNIPYIGSNQLLFPPYNFLVNFRTVQFNTAITKIVQDKQIEIIDLYSKSKQAFSTNSVLYSSDQFHPSSQGYKIWADLINAN